MFPSDEISFLEDSGWGSEDSGAPVLPKAVVDADPFEATLIRVVVASTGSDRVEAPDLLIRWIEGARDRLEGSIKEVEDSVELEATF